MTNYELYKDWDAQANKYLEYAKEALEDDDWEAVCHWHEELNNAMKQSKKYWNLWQKNEIKPHNCLWVVTWSDGSTHSFKEYADAVDWLEDGEADDLTGIITLYSPVKNRGDY